LELVYSLYGEKGFRNKISAVLSARAWRREPSFNPNDPNLPKYREKSALILKENLELINETKALDKKIQPIHKKLHSN